MYPWENHDTVKELGSLVQQAQLRSCVKSNRGTGNGAKSRTQSFANAEIVQPKYCTQRYPFEPRPTSKYRDLRPSVAHNSANRAAFWASGDKAGQSNIEVNEV